MSEREVEVEPMNSTFARVMEVVTYIGLVVMIVPGIISLTGQNVHVDPVYVVKNWDKSAEEFWESAKGIKIHGYDWFLENLEHFDSMCLLGVSILAIAPMVSILAALIRAPRVYRILLAILFVEMVFAVVRPLVLAGGGH